MRRLHQLWPSRWEDLLRARDPVVSSRSGERVTMPPRKFALRHHRIRRTGFMLLAIPERSVTGKDAYQGQSSGPTCTDWKVVGAQATTG